MRLDSIAVKGLMRKKNTLLFLVLGIVIAMGTMVTLYSITTAMNAELADTFDEIGANIMVLPEKSSAVAYGGVTIPGEEYYLENDDIIAINTIENKENIAYVAPKVLGQAEISGTKISVIGVDFPYELQLKKWWTYSGEKPTAINDLLLGNKLADRLGITPGEQVKFGDKEFTVAAVLDPQGNEEDELLFMNLLPAQELLGKENKLSFIEVAAYCTTCPIEQIMGQIQGKIPGARVTALAEAVKARQQVIDSFTAFATAVSIIIALIGALVVMVTMMSSVNQRISEIGIYRAIGYRRRHVLEIILTEATVVGFLGGIIGYATGILIARWLGPAMAQMQIEIGMKLLDGGIVVIAASIVALLASAYPALKAAKMDPSEALRAI